MEASKNTNVKKNKNKSFLKALVTTSLLMSFVSTAMIASISGIYLMENPTVNESQQINIESKINSIRKNYYGDNNENLNLKVFIQGKNKYSSITQKVSEVVLNNRDKFSTTTIGQLLYMKAYNITSSNLSFPEKIFTDLSKKEVDDETHKFHLHLNFDKKILTKYLPDDLDKKQIDADLFLYHELTHYLTTNILRDTEVSNKYSDLINNMKIMKLNNNVVIYDNNNKDYIEELIKTDNGLEVLAKKRKEAFARNTNENMLNSTLINSHEETMADVLALMLLKKEHNLSNENFSKVIGSLMNLRLDSIKRGASTHDTIIGLQFLKNIVNNKENKDFERYVNTNDFAKMMKLTSAIALKSHEIKIEAISNIANEYGQEVNTNSGSIKLLNLNQYPKIYNESMNILSQTHNNDLYNILAEINIHKTNISDKNEEVFNNMKKRMSKL